MPLTIPLSQTSSIFRASSLKLLHCLQVKNKNQEPFFLLPTKHISDDAALLGEALSNLNNQSIHKKTFFRTFFCNSHLEALNGTIKIMRHNSKNKHPILIYDPSDQISQFYNPIRAVYTKELVPGLHFISNLKRIKKELLVQKYIGFICLSNESTDLAFMDELFSICKKKNMYVGYSTGLYKDWYSSERSYIFSSPPDLFLYGENLTEWQIPFGCFSMTEKIYKPWDSINTCLLHSSTFSCNTLSLKFIRSLFTCYSICSFIKPPLEDKKRFAKYAKYVNPKVALLHNAINLSPKAIKAQGCKILFEKNNKSREVLDLVAGSGAAIRGHNPTDFISKVLQRHDPDQDYWSVFEEKIAALSSFAHAFPAVSGASAVDIAITLAMLAAERKTRIITFTENFSGKSLIALNVTRIEEYQNPFKPLYFDIVEINPFSKDGAEHLKKELISGCVGLVWFEIIQGETVKTIPNNILEIIQFYREKQGFLIGIDEILSGLFRTGPFLAHQKFCIVPDMVTIGKGMSDMAFPSSTVLLTKELYQKLLDSHSDITKLLKTYYLHQLSAHIAVHALNWCTENNIKQDVEKYGKYIKESLQNSIKYSSLFREIRGSGLFFYMKLNNNILPVKLFGEYTVEFILSSKLLNECNLLIMGSRLIPALTISKEEIQEVCSRLHDFILKTNQLSLCLFCIYSCLKLCFTRLLSWVSKLAKDI